MQKNHPIVIENGRVLDPATGHDGPQALLVEDGRIAARVPDARDLGADRLAGVRRIDARGCWVTPGFIDLHVHFRDPGEEYKEDIVSGCAAAAAGGFTAVVTMPNTKPTNDTRAVTEYVLRRASEACGVRVYPAAAITMGLAGERLTELGDLADAGVVAFTDDGRPVMSALVMRRALDYSRAFDRPIAVHEEDLTLSSGGVMHEGAVSTALGLKGIPGAAESVMVARDVVLAELTGARLHVCHVSTAAAVRIIAETRSRGVRVTAEVTPHHLVGTDEMVRTWDTATRCSPPLRAARDVEACVDALRGGVIDCIATDHAPHSAVEKEVEYEAAANGMIGLESALPLCMELVTRGALTPLQLVDRLSAGPARVYGLPGGSLAEGAPADVTIVDAERAWALDVGRFRSKSRNCPFHGRKVRGVARQTIVGGRVVYEEEQR